MAENNMSDLFDKLVEGNDRLVSMRREYDMAYRRSRQLEHDIADLEGKLTELVTEFRVLTNNNDIVNKDGKLYKISNLKYGWPVAIQEVIPTMIDSSNAYRTMIEAATSYNDYVSLIIDGRDKHKSV